MEPPLPSSIFVLAFLLVGVGMQVFLERFEPKLVPGDSWDLLFVTDQDTYGSPSDTEGSGRSSTLQLASLVRKAGANEGQYSFEIKWGEKKILTSPLSYQGRAMELSAATFVEDRLLVFCDRSGLVFEVDPDTGVMHVVSALSVINGTKPYKTEWAAVKGGQLVVGSFGKEWVHNKQVVHKHLMYAKVLSTQYPTGSKSTPFPLLWTDLDLTKAFEGMRNESGTAFPNGYLIHEAVAWDVRRRKWIFVPRKVSTDTPYSEEVDERLSGNLLFELDEDFSNIIVKQVGALELDWGFAAIKPLPYQWQPKDSEAPTLFLGTKVYEVKNKLQSKVCVFNSDGEILTKDYISMPEHGLKFEGLAFFPASKMLQRLQQGN